MALSALDVNTPHARQYRLIRYITIELVTVSLLVSCLYAFLGLWYLVVVIGMGGILALLNAWLLKIGHETKLCGHILIFVTFITVLTANYLVRGLGESYSWWFYLIPVLAASLTGWGSLLLYSFFSFLMITAAGIFNAPPFYHLADSQLKIIEWANHLLAFIIIVTTLGSLTRESRRYEQILNERNDMLQIEKERYQYLARVDQLTNLPNRAYFKQHLQEIMESLAVDYCATVFFMDLDNFKWVNDCYGHEIGDQLLLETSKRLLHTFREGDFVARLGGDEFTAIVLHPCRLDTPLAIAKKIIKAFDKPFLLGHIEHPCSISMGLATYPLDSKTVSDLMHKADLAMYVAKNKPGSTYYRANLPF